MGKIAFVFSGQGDQFPGMGKSLYETEPAAKAVFDACEAIRPGTLNQCFEGTADELKETANTQPCLFAMELAAAVVLEEKGIRADMTAGFSLGEVVAATAAGLFTPETGFTLVCRRGQLMQQASEAQDTAMAAVVKLTNGQVESLCQQFQGVYPVNYNCPGQVSVSGLASQMPEFSQAVKAAGGRVLPLKVKGAFHSPFMQEASEAFGAVLAQTDFQKTMIPLYSNLTANPYEGDPVSLLSRQIASPVRWEEIIRNMIGTGVDTFIEIGPGKTLSNMIRKIDGSVKTYCTADLSTLLTEVNPC